ncbi:hypothetical protein MUK42_27886 [Musa troglodytarum]|uniref:Uncharacterized protein n=1 Tax=Musa troglodytarum TaxID=320322 RepID=A0A9E7F1B0_9LILI|nr:hypothetical protein MUK42_27886 [Musa troglodytarum]
MVYKRSWRERRQDSSRDLCMLYTSRQTKSSLSRPSLLGLPTLHLP